MIEDDLTPEDADARSEVEAERRKLETVRWLNQQGQRDLEVGLSVEEFETLRGLIGNHAFGIFWSLVSNARAKWQVVLTNSTLGTPEKDAAASVIQGHIRAFDQIRDLLLQIADPREQTAADGASQ